MECPENKHKHSELRKKCDSKRERSLRRLVSLQVEPNEVSDIDTKQVLKNLLCHPVHRLWWLITWEMTVTPCSGRRTPKWRHVRSVSHTESPVCIGTCLIDFPSISVSHLFYLYS